MFLDLFVNLLELTGKKLEMSFNDVPGAETLLLI